MKNVGTLDRALRLIAGIALIALTVLNVIGPWGWIGVVPIATGLTRICPAYLPFGLRTCPAEVTEEHNEHA